MKKKIFSVDYTKVDWRNLVKYDPDSPSCLSWAIEKIYTTDGRTRRKALNSKAGDREKNGYWRLNYQGIRYQVHRIIMILFNGSIGDFEVDHIDGDRSNNKIENLRLCENNENGFNRAKHSRNVSGENCVYFQRTINSQGKIFDYYVVQWQQDGKRKRKLFRIKDNKEEIFVEACQFRDHVHLICGSPYTERHGK